MRLRLTSSEVLLTIVTHYKQMSKEEEEMSTVSRRRFGGMLLAGAASAVPLLARSQSGGKLTLYMGPPDKTCTAIAQGFEKKTGIKPTFVRLSAGEAINRLRAERDNPQAGQWQLAFHQNDRGIPSTCSPMYERIMFVDTGAT